ncbi:hypothetical protein TEA_023507 [Camellia sinensis var. sinensis]|uniref:Uncharacterized protein n=1 Tax=Camellia sinensis var. sinensis TaxID=542762 RepID=A0A4S4DZB6_CAMSN|nr:hypothetical protein TEA_023507 [Camellia sinensis var. sinensis]
MIRKGAKKKGKTSQKLNFGQTGCRADVSKREADVSRGAAHVSTAEARRTIAERTHGAQKQIGARAHTIAKRSNDENIPVTYRFGVSIEACDVLAVRSTYEFKPEWLKLLQQIHQKPIIPVGQLPTTAYDSCDNNEAWIAMKEWLDGQSKRFEVYVAFRSEAEPSQAELTEIALGLELSELPFFWVLRILRGVSDSEAIQFGKSLILLSFLAETGLNCRVLKEKKMAYLIPRDEQDGSLTRDSVGEAIQDKYVDNLIDFLKKHRQRAQEEN